MVKKVHPDKGGKKEDQQKLMDAKVEWETVVKNSCKPGRPSQTDAPKADLTTEGAIEVAATLIFAAYGGQVCGYASYPCSRQRRFTC